MSPVVGSRLRVGSGGVAAMYVGESLIWGGGQAAAPADFAMPGLLLDDYNRADGGVGASYTTGVQNLGTGNVTVATNKVASNGASSGESRLNATYGSRQGLFLDCAATLPNSTGVVFLLWIQSPETATWSGVRVEFEKGSAGQYRFHITQRTSGGTASTFVDTYSPGDSFVSGDQIGATISPEGLVQAWLKKSGSIYWKEVCSAYSTLTAPASSQVGLRLYGNQSTGYFDNLSGGELVVVEHDQYFGALPEGGNALPSLTKQNTFNALAGKNASIYGWGTGVSSVPSEANLDTIRNAGYIPWWHFETGARTLADIASGVYDGDFDAQGTALAAWGYPIFVRFLHEFNGNWYSWGNQTPSTFISAWQRIVDRHRAQGANNASYIWCSTYDPLLNKPDIRDYYPGDTYVDWHGIDGYRHPGDGFSFTQSIGETYDRHMDVGPSKPVMISEYGTVDQSTGVAAMTKAKWIENSFHAIALRFPMIRALVYFDVNDTAIPADWRLITGTGASTAYAAGVAASRFKTNGYTATAAGKVPIPS